MTNMIMTSCCCQQTAPCCMGDLSCQDLLTSDCTAQGGTVTTNIGGTPTATCAEVTALGGCPVAPCEFCENCPEVLSFGIGITGTLDPTNLSGVGTPAIDVALNISGTMTRLGSAGNACSWGGNVPGNYYCTGTVHSHPSFPGSPLLTYVMVQMDGNPTFGRTCDALTGEYNWGFSGIGLSVVSAEPSAEFGAPQAARVCPIEVDSDFPGVPFPDIEPEIAIGGTTATGGPSLSPLCNFPLTTTVPTGPFVGNTFPFGVAMIQWTAGPTVGVVVA